MLSRPGDAAVVLTVSKSQVQKFEKQGLLTPIWIPGLRAKRYATAQVNALARHFIKTGRRSPATQEPAGPVLSQAKGGTP